MQRTFIWQNCLGKGRKFSIFSKVYLLVNWVSAFCPLGWLWKASTLSLHTTSKSVINITKPQWCGLSVSFNSWRWKSGTPATSFAQTFIQIELPAFHINLLTFYHEYHSLIGYATHYLQLYIYSMKDSE